MSHMSHEDLMHFNADRAARYIHGQGKQKLREELEKEMAKFKKRKQEITVLPSFKPEPRKPAPVPDTSGEYCGNLKAFRIRQWISEGGYNNGRRRRIAELTSLTRRRIEAIACDSGHCVLTNAEYGQIKAAIPKVEAMERADQVQQEQKMGVAS